MYVKKKENIENIVLLFLFHLLCKTCGKGRVRCVFLPIFKMRASYFETFRKNDSIMEQSLWNEMVQMSNQIFSK